MTALPAGILRSRALAAVRSPELAAILAAEARS
jgi:hypothetical protein